jgi:RHS repeat-associated protein
VNGKFDPSKTVTAENIAPYISTIRTIWWDGDETSGSLSSNYYTFTGRRYDPESELMCYRNRYYSPELGRFVSRDPIGYFGGINLYAYVYNRPVLLTDALGLAAIKADIANGIAGFIAFSVVDMIDLKSSCCRKYQQDIEAKISSRMAELTGIERDLTALGITLMTGPLTSFIGMAFPDLAVAVNAGQLGYELAKAYVDAEGNRDLFIKVGLKILGKYADDLGGEWEEDKLADAIADIYGTLGAIPVSDSGDSFGPNSRCNITWHTRDVRTWNGTFELYCYYRQCDCVVYLTGSGTYTMTPTTAAIFQVKNATIPQLKTRDYCIEKK